MEESDAPQSQDNTANKSNESTNSSVLGNSGSATESPASPSKGCHPYHYQHPAKPWWKTWTLVQVIVELLVFGVGIKVACIYSRQLLEMITSNRISHDALVASQRPWLANDGAATITIDGVSNDSVSGSFTFTTKNFGPSPALVVGQAIHPFVRRLPETTDVFEEARKAACQQADTVAFITGNSIFPQQTYPYTTTGSFYVPGITPEYGMILISGCIAYRDQFDTSKTTHHTTFCLMGSLKKPATLSLCGKNERAD